MQKVTVKYVAISDAYDTLTEKYHHTLGVQHEALKEALAAVPAADVRPVVLCRDCVKYKTKYCAIDIWYEDVTIFKARDTDFCSYGERNPQIV